MKIILSTDKYSFLKSKLEKANSIPEVYEQLMNIKYFCFLSIENKKELFKLSNELLIYKRIFDAPLFITVLHNSHFYEEYGISKLNYWEYFRNIKEIKNNPISDEYKNRISEQTEYIINQIKANDFNKKEVLKLTFKGGIKR